MALREIESALPPGFRFFPSDEELVCHYLHKKVCNERIPQGTLVEVDLHAREPWELPEVAKLTAGEWYFFSFRDRKYATGSRTNRATRTGYWKATGKDREVRADDTSGTVVGMRKTLVFYRGRAPNGAKTGWVMHEFRLHTPHTLPREDWVICRVFQKGKGDGDGQGNVGGASSPNFAHGSTSRLMLDDQAMRGQYGNLLHLAAGSSTDYAPPQDQVRAGGLNAAGAAVPTNAHYGGATVIDRRGSFFPQETCGALPADQFYRNGGVVGDEHGFNGFLDMDFGDMANHGSLGFPQEWN